MVVVDTTVWINSLRGVESSEVLALRRLIEEDAAALTDAVLMELLQGPADERVAQQTEAALDDFPVLQLNGLSDFRAAAGLSRAARRKGFDLATSFDLLIAVVCIREDKPLLHADKDFDRLAACTPLRSFDPS